MSSGPEPLAALVARSLTVLRRECPDHARQVQQACAGLTVEVTLPGENFWIVAPVEDAAIRVDGRLEASPCIERRIDVQTSREALIRLVEGAEDIVEQLSTGALKIRGTVGELARLDRAVHWYVHGAIRSMGHRALRDHLFETSEPS